MGGDTMKQLYDSYKPSGIDWIGEIPSHWELLRMRFLCDMITGDKDTVNKVDDGNYPFYVRSPQIERINSYSFDGEAVLMAGDGVGAGKVVHYANGKFDFHQRVYNFHNFKGIKGILLYYYLKTLFKYKIEEGGAKNTVDSVRQPWLKDFPICVPPLAEQEAIAAWLDETCGEIDAAIAKVDRELELIDELKQSEISRVVTRGLYPTAPLLPSGIDWIGDIPSNWMVKPLKYHSDIIMGQSPSGNDITEEGTILFMQGNAEFGQIYPNPTTYCNMCVKHSRINDILMSVRAPVGELNISDKIYGIGRGLCSIRPINLNRQFLWYYLLKSKTDFDYFSNGSTFSAITMQTLLDFPIVIPPLSEQQAIADYLDKKCAEIDGLKAKLVKKRETLKELRQAIISEVVTGNRKVV